MVFADELYRRALAVDVFEGYVYDRLVGGEGEPETAGGSNFVQVVVAPVAQDQSGCFQKNMHEGYCFVRDDSGTKVAKILDPRYREARRAVKRSGRRDFMKRNRSGIADSNDGQAVQETSKGKHGGSILLLRKWLSLCPEPVAS